MIVHFQSQQHYYNFKFQLTPQNKRNIIKTKQDIRALKMSKKSEKLQ